MGQNAKVNVGLFTEQMQWFEAVSVRTSSGGVDKSWKPLPFFFAEVVDEGVVDGDNQYRDRSQKKLVFRAWFRNVDTTYKVVYNGAEYMVESVKRLQRGLYAEYVCVSEQ